MICEPEESFYRSVSSNLSNSSSSFYNAQDMKKSEPDWRRQCNFIFQQLKSIL